MSLDLETTGLDPHLAEIIELGAVCFVEGEPKERFSSLVRPEGRVPAEITKLTGIAPGDLEEAPPLEEVLPRLLQFVGQRTIVAHKADFDRSFLEAGAERSGIPLPHGSWLDTILLGRALLPRLYNHRLETLAGELGLSLGGLHRAAADAERAGFILTKLLQRALEVPLAALPGLAMLSPSGPRLIFNGLVDYRRERGLVGRPRGERAKLWEPRPEQVQEEFQLDLNGIEEVFGEDGPLAKGLSSFGERPGQIAMAREVAQAFNDSGVLIAEAGSGTGKSFAYLVPAILWARERGRKGRVVVSTNTKNLQDQLFSKDLPFLRKVFGDFRAVLLKGRSNYICRHKWESSLLESSEGLGLKMEEGLVSIPVWLEETETGDITENNALQKAFRKREIVHKLADTPDYCLGRECRFFEDCFSVKARRAAKEAVLVVVNHSLLLSDLELDQGLLGEYRCLIVDEAHNLEEAASERLTQQLSFWGLNDLLDELHQAKGSRAVGLLPLLRERVGKSGLRAGLKEKILDKAEEGIEAVKSLRRRGKELFARLTEALREAQGLQQEDYPLEHPEKGRYGSRIFQGLGKELEAGLALVAEPLEKLKLALEELDDGSLLDQKRLWGRAAAGLVQVEELIGLIHFLGTADDDGFVYWFELPREMGHLAILYATPAEVAELLYERLFRGLDAAIFTSATLAVAGDFGYLTEHLGLDRLPPGRLRTCSFGHPFNYQRNVLLAVPEFLPSPNEQGFHRELAKLLLELSRRVERRMMVLFTSYKLMQQVQRELGEGALFVQGLDGSRAQITEEFRRSPTRRAILLGTSSFWEGVDLPGESLELLVLTRLPFPVPSEPVVAARAERIAAQGRDPFQDYFLPLAVLKLRQGFGRLIRTHRDRGAVIIADNRIVHQRYGRSFRKSLPLEATTYYTPSRLLVELAQFLSR